MKKCVALLMAFALLLQSSVHAALSETNGVVRETILVPFDIASDEVNGEKVLDISHLKNAEVLQIVTDNGAIVPTIENGLLKLHYSDGVKTNGVKSRKVTVWELEDVEYDEEVGAVVIKPEKEVTAIKDVFGAFESAYVGEKGEIVAKVKADAAYRQGVSEEKTAYSEFEIEVNADNRERYFVTEWMELPYKLADEEIAVIDDTSTVERIEVKDNSIRVHFSGGIPERNTEYETGGHTYFWIDRFQDGSFKKYNPNSVYTTDKNIISGEGTYLGEKDRSEIGMTLQNETWSDFCGVEIDGKNYIHVFDKSKGLPELKYNESFAGEEIEIEGGGWNSERYIVNLSKAGVSYFPEGKLFSMGKLVTDTENWGEEVKNHDWESKETFLNPLTGDFETYVKHFKFYYGPQKKIAFGGYYTYPYNCTLRYKHYQPVKLYSGGIAYEYESMREKEYEYSGYVKIAYDGAQSSENVSKVPQDIAHIALTGRVEPRIVLQGETIDLFAETESFYEIASVQAVNNALKLDVSLFPEDEEVPTFCEISYEVVPDSFRDYSKIDIKNTRFATNKEGVLKNKAFTPEVGKTENGFILGLPMKIAFEKEGSFVIPNENQRELSEKVRYIRNALCFSNASKKGEEVFLEVANEKGSKEEIISQLRVHSLRYKADNTPIYYTVELDKEMALKPITATWKTDVSGVTEFHVFCGEKDVFRFRQSYERIKNSVESFTSYFCEKDLTKYEKAAYRLLFLDRAMSAEARERHQKLLEGEDTVIQEGIDESIYGNFALERQASFNRKGISIPLDAEPGKYSIVLTAKDIMGNIATTEVVLQVKEAKRETQDTSKKDPIIGRFFYDNNRGYMEELKKPKQIDNAEGFICAGETLALRIKLRNTAFLQVELAGDKSIKTLDSLTKRFLCKDGDMSEEDLEESYEFPKILYPVEYDPEEDISVFEMKYIVPYRTKQTLHSWSTLKTSSLEEIDTERLFERQRSPYRLLLYPNGDEERERVFKFDVFERWDTVLNRDISKYLENSGDRKRVLLET